MRFQPAGKFESEGFCIEDKQVKFLRKAQTEVLGEHRQERTLMKAKQKQGACINSLLIETFEIFELKKKILTH